MCALDKREQRVSKSAFTSRTRGLASICGRRCQSSPAEEQRRIDARRTRELDWHCRQRRALTVRRRLLDCEKRRAVGFLVFGCFPLGPGELLQNIAAIFQLLRTAGRRGSPSKFYYTCASVSGVRRPQGFVVDWSNHVLACNVPALDLMRGTCKSKDQAD